MRIIAGLVHGFTALGAVCALFAVLAIAERAWELAFLWLGLALIIDGVDGVLARRVKVGEHLPRFSGERLDLVIDYLTYVFVPVLALLAAGKLTSAFGLGLASAILASSLYHFADKESKSPENAFVGFPALWNIVAFYVFAFDPSSRVTALAVTIFVALTFVRCPWVHPIRVNTLRPLTLALCMIWALTAGWVLWRGFPAGLAERAVLGAIAAYGVGLALVWRR